MELVFQKPKDGLLQTKCGAYKAERVAAGWAVIDCRTGHTIVVVKTMKEAKETILDFGY